MADVKVYVTSYCPYCVRAKALLSRKKVAFQEIDVTGDDAQRDWLVETTGRRTVPQIFINNQPVGGCDDLYALDRAGELDKLLSASPG
ncbi:MAG: glutaredoxin 3 [Myxococcales bacterium]|nr:glutaredoxin 3 [Myxococcales bacterium]